MSDGIAPQRIGIGGWPVCAIEFDRRVREYQPGRVSAGQCQMDVRLPSAGGKIPQQLFSKTNHSTLPVIVAVVKRKTRDKGKPVTGYAFPIFQENP